ncbi:hypothetical protein [Cuniculiplasma divulgatum]|jgi:hypothetical protein|uniref:Uncharacterized protein n=1 Tax=Cuniculiplasma divulgatum TaxID=1673428 RepID=A0A1N5UPP2_9ARCH|nr:hypothetical protein [Cuniculiplasma divulgatum]SIM62288.1 hypothetical protein CSP5_1054 [Cuniculiplasma divulgatum]
MERKQYTANEKLKIINRSRYIKIVKSEKDLKENDIFVQIKKNGKKVYIVAQK